MLVKADLHIHSVLSACCDVENTIKNIINMSVVLESKIIAIADHNSAANVRAAYEYGKQQGVLVVPAMEVTTAEDIHMLCLFETVQEAEDFSKIIQQGLPKYPLLKKFYNPQLILNENDEVLQEIEYLLNVGCAYDVHSLTEAVRARGGVAVPAHVDRQSNSIVSVLGTIPEELDFTTVEVSVDCSPEKKAKLQEKYTLITGSDAHSLEEMCRGDFYLEVPEISTKAVLDKLMKKI